MANRAEGHAGNRHAAKPPKKHLTKSQKKSNPFFRLVNDNTKNPKKDWATSGNTEITSKKSPWKPKAKAKPKARSTSSTRSHSSASHSSASQHSGGGSSRSGGTRSVGRNGGGNGRGSKGKGGGGGGGGGSLRKQAAKMVQGDIDTAIRALEREKAKRGYDRDLAVGKANALFGRSKGDLEHVFGEVQENTAKNNKIIDDRYTKGRAEVSSLYGALNQKLGDTANSNRDAAMAELSRLGIQRAGLGNFDADAANQQGVASTNAANADANMNASQTAAAQVGGMLSSMGSSSLASAIGRATNTRNDFISDSENAYRADVSDIYDQERDEQLQKGSKTNDLWMQLDDRRFARKESNRNFALARQSQNFSQGMANNNFNLSVSRFNSDNLWKQAAQRQEDRRQAALRRQQSRALRGSSRPNTSGGRSLSPGV